MRVLFFFINTAVITAGPLLYLFLDPPAGILAAAAVLITLFPVINIFPGVYRNVRVRLAVLAGGSDLLTAFIPSVTVESVILLMRIFEGLFTPAKDIPFIVLAVIADAVVFWNGMIRVYATSVQLGITWRVLAAVFSWVPVVNFVFLVIIIIITDKEYRFEKEYDRQEKQRAEARVCATKYPILLVHGVFFRDSKKFNYWGRVPEALERCGATIYYGNQQSALSVRDSAAELARRIEQIVNETGCGKVNIIAHSKGGLDSRYAISVLGCDKYVASLTTVCTPNRGCVFVEKLYDSMPEGGRQALAATYNAAARTVGDTAPDFLSAVADMRYSACEQLNSQMPDSPSVFYQSIGSVERRMRSGKFPLNVSYPLVKKTDGANDGLVAVESMKWGRSFRLVEPAGTRGISHADMIDLNRENIDGFDIREFYVNVVKGLKDRGL